MATDLTPYLPRLLLHWDREAPDRSHRSIDGTLVFADVSGFTRLSERLARRGGKIGAEQMTDVINSLFGELLLVAARRGGEMLKYGGDALLLLFRGEAHAPRAAAAAMEMQRRLHEVGRVDTGGAGVVRLRMSVGMNSGAFDFFVAGGSHRELVVAGPAATATVEMEAAAGPGEVLLSAATASCLPDRHQGAAKAGGHLLRGVPPAPSVETSPEPPSPEAAAFVSVALRDYLAGGLVEPDHRQATVAFLHLMGIDRLLETKGPEDVAGRLHEALVVIQDAFEAYGVSFLATDLAADGTKVIAAAGTPISSSDNEERMLRALRRILDAGTALAIRAGVNRGHVFAGDVGPAFRRTYTTIGDVINTAARVMGRAAAGELLCLGPVLERSPSQFEVAELEPFMAKGKLEPLVPFRVGPLIGQRPKLGADLPLVGREKELAVLTAALAAARTGVGGVVEILAEVGMGKTRLLEEALAGVDEISVVRVTCDHYESTTAYSVLRSLLRQVLGLVDDPPEQAGRRLGERVREIDAGLLPWLPLLALPLDIAVDPTAEVERLDPNFVKARLGQHVGDVLEGAQPGAALWLIEDTQWMDEASASLFREVFSRPDPPPWLVVLSGRPTESGFAAGQLASTALPLGPLSPEEATALAHTAAPGRFLPEQLHAIVEQSGGSPLYLIELLHSRVSAGEPGDLPESIEELMQAKIDGLDPGDRRLLRQASVLGRTVDVALLEDMLELPPGTAGADVGRLEEFLAGAGPGRWRFRQALLRDVTYECLPFRQRQRLHLRAGEAIERRAASPEDRAELLSLHFYQGRDWSRAARFSRVAGERARAKFASLEAATFFRRTIDVERRLGSPAPDQGRLWHELALVLLYAGLYDESAEAARQGRRVARADPLLQAQLLVVEGDVKRRQGDGASALRRYQHGLGVLDPLQAVEAHSWRSRLLTACALIRHFQAKFRAAVDLGEQSVSEAEAAGDDAALAHAHAALFSAHTALGDAERAVRYRELPLRVFADKGALWHLASFQTALGISEYEAGRWDAAQEWYASAAATAERAGDVHRQAIAANNRGEILSDQGRLDEAEEAFRAALAVWQPASYRLGLAVATENLGRALGRRGRFDEALALLAEAASQLLALGAAEHAAYARAWEAEALAHRGQAEQALERVAAADRHRPAGVAGQRVTTLLRRVEALALAQLGQAGAAGRAFEESMAVARAADLDYELAVTAHLWHALGARAGGAPPGAAETAGAIFARLGVVAAPPLPAG